MSIPRHILEQRRKDYKRKATRPLDMEEIKKRSEEKKEVELNKRLDNICEVCGYMCDEYEKIENVMYDLWTCRKCHYKEHQ